LTKAVLELQARDSQAARSTLEAYAQRVGENRSPLYYSALSLAEAVSTDLDAAVAVANEGVARHPGSAALANNAGVIMERKGDFERARELYELAFEQESALPQVSKNLGDLLYRNGRYDEAAEAYRRAIRTEPDLGDDVYAKLGNVYYKSRDRDQAVEMWEQALKINPGNEIVRTNLEFVRGSPRER
jgi:tetratricopeptide (TPR) repeat protein